MASRRKKSEKAKDLGFLLRADSKCSFGCCPVKDPWEGRLEVMYDTSKMGTPEHRDRVEKNIQALIQKHPKLTRHEARMYLVMQDSPAAHINNSSGTGTFQKFCNQLRSEGRLS